MQTWAIFNDTLRLLKARKLFWLSLLVSLIIGVALTSIRYNDSGWTFGFGLQPFENEDIRAGTFSAERHLLGYFGQVIRWWLTFFGIILALLSTASIFPEMVTSGAIEWMVSKPISRWRLFVTKYASGLLFAGIQAVVVVICLWVAIRWRLGFWHHAIWWTVPLVLVFYSNLFAIMAWVSMITRSAVSALLITLLAWAVVGSVQFVEHQLGQLSRTGTMMSGLVRIGDDADQRHHADEGRRLAQFLMLPLPKTAEISSSGRRIAFGWREAIGRGEAQSPRQLLVWAHFLKWSDCSQRIGGPCGLWRSTHSISLGPHSYSKWL
jgi:ABC-type transport system involved in multi-copper enzyme maturation permease subunit